MRRFWADESGLSVTEYGLLLALVAIALVAVVRLAGSSLASFFTSNTQQVMNQVQP